MTSALMPLGFRPYPWRSFRHGAAARTRFPAWGFVVLFVLSLVLAHACQRYFGAIAIWPANGVLVAALLLLDRKRALGVLGLCFLINCAFDWDSDTRDLREVLTFASLNALEAFAIAVIARRFCGAALRLGRPVRLMRFALFAAAPPIIAAALVGLWLIGTSADHFGLYFASWVSVELLGCLVVAPSIVMLAHKPPPAGKLAAPRPNGLFVLLGMSAFTALVCLRAAPLPIATILPVLLLGSLRLTPRQAAIAVLLIAAITTTAFLFEHSTFEAFILGASTSALGYGSDITTRLPSFYVFLTAILATIYPAATVVSEKARLQERLLERATAARQDAAELAVAKDMAEQATEAKRRFLNMISHELRTPLGQVAGYTTWVANDPGLTESSREQIAKISMANSHALELVDNMIDFARGDLLLENDPLDLRELVGTVVDHVRMNVPPGKLEVRFENRLGDRDYVMGDARRLRQLLRLLLHNAVKFTESGEIGIEAESTGGGARLIVFDTGCGFEADRLPELLQAFAQGDASISRAKEGTGVGLALAHQILKAMGGDWTFDSRPGGGTRVTLDLPLALAERPKMAGPVGRPPRLLVVDDHAANREILGLLLRSLGCETEYASDGVDAVDAARNGTFDAILMDLRMPHMDGMEATRRIRSLPGRIAQVPILAVSAETRADNLAPCRTAGMDGFLSKPVSRLELIDQLNIWLDPEATNDQRARATA
ncbi:response regulator [Brevundimonas aveniformis]|uniref:response regulator n=1 Tax=Brevundimonas aveniformis TaxID=370977 RepID=UPI0004903FA9|nr:response regulator [Brevundimonas aveniformis]